MRFCFVFLSLAFCLFDKTYQEKYEITKTVKNRTFIVLYNPSTTDAELIQQLRETIEHLRINKTVDFTNEKLALSFFTSKEFADYKPTQNDLYGKWKQSYIGEYDNSTKRLTIYPIHAEKQKNVVLKV